MFEHDLLFSGVNVHLHGHAGSGEEDTFAICSESSLISDIVVQIGASNAKNMLYFSFFGRKFVVSSRIRFEVCRRENLTFKLRSTECLVSFFYFFGELIIFGLWDVEHIGIFDENWIVFPDEDGLFLASNGDEIVFLLIEQNGRYSI